MNLVDSDRKEHIWKRTKQKEEKDLKGLNWKVDEKLAQY